MMFIQYFAWGSWFATLGAALGANGLGDWNADAYASAPIAAITAPLFLGLIADRFFASERVMGALFLLGGLAMFLAYRFAQAGQGQVMVWCLVGHMLCYMPTMALSNAIAFTHIDDPEDFPRARVWGTIGWIAAGLTVGVAGWSIQLELMLVASVASIIMGAYSFSLPHTPPPARHERLDVRSLLMLDAFKLLARPSFLAFVICSIVLCVAAAYYYGVASIYLAQAGFVAPAALMTIGQMSEIVFMLLLPVSFRHLGVKKMILIGMAATALRYALFALGAPAQVAWMLLGGVALHGVCYDFFFVTGFMYTDEVAGARIRGQAQSMFVFFTQGLGMYLGFEVAFGRLSATVPRSGELNEIIAASQVGDPDSFFAALSKMVEIEAIPAEPALLRAVMDQWQDYWWLPAGIAAVATVLFAIAFRDRRPQSEP